MIKEISRLPQLPENSPAGVRIAATHKAYCGMKGYALYMQAADGKACYISCLYGNAVVCGDIGDISELAEFLKMTSQTVFCSLDMAKRLEINIIKIANIMQKNIKNSKKPLPLYPAYTAKEAYEALLSGTDGNIELPDYETFAADFLLRCRKGVAGGIVEKNCCALCFNITEQSAFIGGVAVKLSDRKSGQGKMAVDRLCEILPADKLFVCCLDNVKGFYEKCGFSYVGQAAYCKI